MITYKSFAVGLLVVAFAGAGVYGVHHTLVMALGQLLDVRPNIVWALIFALVLGLVLACVIGLWAQLLIWPDD